MEVRANLCVCVLSQRLSDEIGLHLRQFHGLERRRRVLQESLLWKCVEVRACGVRVRDQSETFRSSSGQNMHAACSSPSPSLSR